tara:strand:+ start:60 stop:581 length:522 start_codon:yes stop_codon:yes gene_type:complete
MKRLLIPFALLLAGPCYADITHTLQSVVSVSTVGASTTSNRIGSTISLSGSNVTPTANTVSGNIGSLDLADITNGVAGISYDTSFEVTSEGDSWSVQESYLEADAIPDLLSGDVTDGVISSLPIFGDVVSVSGGDPGSVEMTLDSGQELSVTLTDMGSGTTATMQSTMSLEID